MLDYGEFVPGALASSSDAALAALGAKTDLVPYLRELDYNGEEGCVELVLAGTHAHTETYSYAKLIYSDLGHGASVYAMRPQLYEGNLAFFFRRKTPWRPRLDAGLSRLVESGLVQKWYGEIMEEKTAAMTVGIRVSCFLHTYRCMRSCTFIRTHMRICAHTQACVRTYNQTTQYTKKTKLDTC